MNCIVLPSTADLQFKKKRNMPKIIIHLPKYKCKGRPFTRSCKFARGVVKPEEIFPQMIFCNSSMDTTRMFAEG